MTLQKNGWLIKVAKIQNDFMKASFLTKYERKIVGISALHTAEILTIFLFIFWEKQGSPKDDFVNISCLIKKTT